MEYLAFVTILVLARNIFLVDSVPVEKSRDTKDIKIDLIRDPGHFSYLQMNTQNSIQNSGPNRPPIESVLQFPPRANTNIQNHRLNNNEGINSPGDASKKVNQRITPSKIINTLSHLSRTAVIKESKKTYPASYAKVNKYSPSSANEKQDEQTESTLEITSVSPIESSFGGLTGLQGLPALSMVQAVKLLVAVFPFMIPIIFVPLLLFTIGMFMIPIVRVNHFVDAQDGELDGLIGLKSRAFDAVDNASQFIKNKLSRFARNFVEQENCIEKFSCQIKNKIFSATQLGRLHKTFLTLMQSVNLGDRDTVTVRVVRSLAMDTMCSSFRCTITNL